MWSPTRRQLMGGLASVSALSFAPETSHAAPRMAVNKHVLPNGLTLLSHRDPRLPVVAMEVRYLVGSAHERKGRSGFAHLFEHLMFQGSRSYPGEYFAPYEPIGGVVNGTTNVDRTNYFERVPAAYLELPIWMESDRMGGLLDALDQKKLDNQRDVVKNERRQRYENPPYGLVPKLMQNNLYPEGHPYQHTTIGSHADLTAATLDDVRNFFREYYVPSNAYVTLAGAFDEDRALKLIERYFGSLPAGKRTPMPVAALPPQPTNRIEHPDKVRLPRVHFVWHTPALYKEGDAAMDIFASLLTSGKTSRLYQPLVYEQQMAKDVGAYQRSMALSSMFVVQATAAPGVSVQKLSDALRVSLEKALQTPPTKDEFDRVLNGWKKSFFGRVESVISKATTISTYEHIAGNANYLNADLERYTALTPESVLAQVKRYIDPEKALAIDVVPRA
ncbi:MAG: pitrilysin family protein [Myxococcota bacterium]